MRISILSIPILLVALQANAATITGIVRAQPREGAESGARGGGNYDSRKFKFADRINYAELKDFVVFVEGTLTNQPARPGKRAQVLTQKDATFRPHVLPVLRGTTVEWPNEDDIYHNVFSVSEVKSFDLGLYKSAENKSKFVTFDIAGRADVFCSIHSAMHCIVLVLENPFFAVTDTKGRYVVGDVPPGNYKLKAWHERLPPQIREITVPESGEVKIDFVLGFTDLPKY